VTEEGFAVKLGDRSWTLPHLPFRIIKSIQPALFKVYSDTATAGNAALTELQIDDLASSTWRAIAHVEPDLGYDDFLALRFSVADLLAALPSVAQAAGLRTHSAASEASPGSGKSISTT
jgi:hypothetical protein